MLPGIVVEQVNASVAAIVLDVVAEKERPFEVEIGFVSDIGEAAHATAYAYAQPWEIVIYSHSLDPPHAVQWLCYV